MTLRQAGLFALAFVVGCLRFGYDVQSVPTDQTPETTHDDGGIAEGMDAAVADAGALQDASIVDASAPAPDAASDAGEAGALDASAAHDSSVPDDDAAQEPVDSGPTDGGSSATGLCALTVTMNTYVRSPHYHGTLALQNASTTTWTMPTIRFDLRSSVYVCDSAVDLPGAGWTLESSGGHCTYIKTAPSLSIAPGATLTFEYSSDDPGTSSSPGVSNISVSGCP